MGIPPVLTPRRVLECATRPRWAYQLVRHKPFTLRNLVEGVGAAAAVRSVQLQTAYLYPDMSWGDLDWVRSQWPGPVFVKGVMDPEDAEIAVSLGVDGLVVSNHGGRQLESGVGTLDVLPEVVDAVANRAEVLVDGGIRRGTDIVKALSLGARAVLIGRPFVYGLADGKSVQELDRSWIRGFDNVSVETRKA